MYWNGNKSTQFVSGKYLNKFVLNITDYMLFYYQYFLSGHYSIFLALKCVSVLWLHCIVDLCILFTCMHNLHRFDGFHTRDLSHIMFGFEADVSSFNSIISNFSVHYAITKPYIFRLHDFPSDSKLRYSVMYASVNVCHVSGLLHC